MYMHRRHKHTHTQTHQLLGWSFKEINLGFGGWLGRPRGEMFEGGGPCFAHGRWMAK